MTDQPILERSAVARRYGRLRRAVDGRLALLIATVIVVVGAALLAAGGHLAQVATWGLVAATLRFLTPLTFAALGGLISERSGVINIALEGMMLTGAFFGLWGSVLSGSWLVGLVVAMLAGAGVALLHAFFSITIRSDQLVVGVALNLLALGATGYLFRLNFTTQGPPPGVSRIPEVTLAWLGSVPILGDVFGSLNLLIWVVLALVPLTYLVLFRTPLGLRIRAVGEYPLAADTVGIDVFRIRYAAVVVSGVLAALGGAYLSIGFVGSFSENMTAGRGYIALAAVIFGKWRPLGAFAAASLFGFSSAMAQRLQNTADLSANLLQTLPYILTLIALVGLIGRSRPPASVGQPYAKQQ